MLAINAQVLTGPTIVRLMRANKKTIRGLSQKMGISMERVREVRKNGVKGAAYVMDWMEWICYSN